MRSLSRSVSLKSASGPDTFSSISDLAMVLHRRRQYQDALPLYQKAYAGFEKTLGPDHPLTQRCAKDYSKMLDTMRRDSETKTETETKTEMEKQTETQTEMETQTETEDGSITGADRILDATKRDSETETENANVTDADS